MRPWPWRRFSTTMPGRLDLRQSDSGDERHPVGLPTFISVRALGPDKVHDGLWMEVMEDNSAHD